MKYFWLILWSLAVLAGACSYTQKIRDGHTAFDRKQYHLAATLLKKDFEKSKSRVEQGRLAFLIGWSHKEMHQAPQAIEWFKIAYNYQYGPEALKEYAFALKQDEQYREAMNAFKELGLEVGSPYEYRKEIAACQVALGWKENPDREYLIDPVPFNSGRADYAPVLYRNGQIVFSSDRSQATGDDIYAWTGNKFSDLFVYDPQTREVQNFSEQLNSEQNEGTAAFNADFTEIIFSRCFGEERFDDQYCKLMISKRQGDQWSKPDMLPFVEPGINYGHPSLSADGNTLYFSCNHPDGWGGFDIYEVQRTNGQWGEPQIMSRSINTPGNEQFPFIHEDTLYFASNGHTGMGGLDIFRTYRLPNGTWAPVYNLKAPINSGHDDFAMIILPPSDDPNILAQGYFSSNRPGGSGGDDIYRFTRRIPEEPVEPVASIDPADYKIFLEVYVLEKIFQVADDPNTPVLARKPIPNARVEMTVGDKTRQLKTNDNGVLELKLDDQTAYYFLAAHPGFLNNEARFSTFGIGKDPNNPEQRFELEIVLDKVYLGKEITLSDIYYDFDRWDIRADARPTLDKLAQLLLLNPEIEIEMGSHTDCRGSARYNELLSQRRAQSAVDYLVQKGVSGARLSARGYGESSPANDCICNRCTEDEHQQNRRTTFRIIQ